MNFLASILSAALPKILDWAVGKIQDWIIGLQNKQVQKQADEKKVAIDDTQRQLDIARKNKDLDNLRELRAKLIGLQRKSRATDKS